MGKVGRMRKLDEKMKDEICKHIAVGCPFKVAANLAGIGTSTFFLWKATAINIINELKDKKQTIENASKEDIVYLEFLDAIKKAEAEAIRRNVVIINAAANDHWQAAAWWLERRIPNEFARKERLEITGEDGAPIQIGYVERIKKLREDRGLPKGMNIEIKKGLNIANEINSIEEIDNVKEKKVIPFLKRIKNE